MAKKATSMDVAKLAGVSQSSVSRAFGHGAKVSAEKHQRIMEAAAKLGYSPNAIARGLITRKTNMIGIVMRNIKNPFYPEVLEKFYQALFEKGYHILFINAENEKINEDEVVKLIEYNVDGVIITDATPTLNAIERFISNGIPVVLFNRYVDTKQCSAVYCNNYQAGYDIGQLILNKGFTNIAFVSGPMNTSTTRDRLIGLKDSLQTTSVSFREESGHYTYEGGYEAALQLTESNRPDVIVCGNDIMAFGVIDGVKKRGLRIPEDIAIIGFDDVSMASWPSYALTTWKQPVDEMVNETVALICEEIDSEETQTVRKAIDGQLIIRETFR
ncbi:transcriptional regulator [Niallia circulans]|uniref:LacI family DNA-binding transcriptional regulator n=1 Tax=Shouchella clausii TaxID=79880 RepID=UPI000BA68437|nr:LacI family DNA-binding transcriptional regulator [Shouchella clausii]MCM3548304.1 LacI family DNA-binding transcriptional regulator [Shouchella clausii]PAF12121.1 LacI family transcriptional regulator [Shouchella clausii]SPT77678.1 transcriptional regulator [Niallia circulans]